MLIHVTNDFDIGLKRVVAIVGVLGVGDLVKVID